MTRFAFIVLAMIALAQAFENRGLRARMSEFENEYDRFLATAALKDKILPGSVAVFGYKSHRLACGVLK